MLGDYRQNALDFYSLVLHSPIESTSLKSQLTCTKLSNIHPIPVNGKLVIFKRCVLSMYTYAEGAVCVI